MKLECMTNPFDVGIPLKINRESKINHPDKIGWPDDFSEELRQKLAHLGTLKVIGRGQPVCYNTEDPGSICIITSGALKSQIFDAEGTYAILGFYLPGEIISLHTSPVPSLPYETIALSTCQLYILSTDALKPLLIAHPEFFDFYHKVSQMALLDAYRRTILTGNLDSDQKIAFLLLNLYSRIKHQQADSAYFQLPMSRIEISQHLFLSPETVSRSFSKFQMKGFIQADRNEIYIKNQDGLFNVLSCQQECSPAIARPA